MVDAADKPVACQRVAITPGGTICDLDENGRFPAEVPRVDAVKCELSKEGKRTAFAFEPVLNIREGQIVEQTFVVPAGAKID